MKNNDGVISNKEGFSIDKDESSGLNMLVFPKGKVVTLSEGLFMSTSALNKNKLQEVVIPDTVETIGNRCFKSCSELERVIIPDSVTTIGKACFNSCKKLRYIKLPNNIRILPEALFSWCLNLKDVDIPNGVEAILDTCFANCTNLKSVTLSETVSQIGESVFSNCGSLESFQFNDKIKHISDGVFSGCENLEAVVLPKCLTSIGKMAFLGCYKLKDLKLSNFLNSIGERAFEDCSSLTSITIPSSVTHIGENAFYNCHNVKSITILPKLSQDKNAIEIQDGAFCECDKVEELILPRGALNNENAFDFNNMHNLKRINYLGKDILKLSDGEEFKNLIYNGKLIYLEYTNEEGQIISKVLEDITSNRRDIRAIELTRRFNCLLENSIFNVPGTHYISKERLCLNMLTVIGYKNSISLLELLMKKREGNSLKSGKEIQSGDTHKKSSQEAEATHKKEQKRKLTDWFKTFFGKKNQEDNTTPTSNIDVDDYLEELFYAPKIIGNTSASDFLKFFSDNITSISELNSSEDVINLANIQRDFQVFMKDPILKRKLQSGKLTLEEVFQNRCFDTAIGQPEEFAYTETETKKPVKYDKDSREL